MLQMGVVGAPNKGKSTFFAAATLVDVPIADYPFTTIEANRGVTFVRAECPHKALGLAGCNARNSRCVDGVRLIPTTLIDVAGLVPGAHLGRGMGNAFLSDVGKANALIQVVDASGRTDLEGRPCERCDPGEEVRMLEGEVAAWIASILRRAWPKIRGKGAAELEGTLSGLGIARSDIEKAAEACHLSVMGINWSEADILAFAAALRQASKPVIIAANKIDLDGAADNLAGLRRAFPDKKIFPCFAEGELALRRAAEKGLVKYVPGDPDFRITGSASERQVAALESIRSVMRRHGGTGVQPLINEAAFSLLNLIVVYPVEDEHKLADHFGSILPDALLLPRGSTVLDLAGKIHSDLAAHFIHAIDCRTQMRVGREHVLRDGDVIKIVSGKASK
ncbi:MAG: redox-regulated ATPase YchF [Candidatus Micrarchaeia archaeon]